MRVPNREALQQPLLREIRSPFRRGLFLDNDGLYEIQMTFEGIVASASREYRIFRMKRLRKMNGSSLEGNLPNELFALAAGIHY